MEPPYICRSGWLDSVYSEIPYFPCVGRLDVAVLPEFFVPTRTDACVSSESLAA